MFLNVVSWAKAKGGPESPGGAARLHSLLALAAALAEKLRSVFVPYFEYLLDICVEVLEGEGEGTDPGKAQAKKRRKGGAGLGEITAEVRRRPPCARSNPSPAVRARRFMPDRAERKQAYRPVQRNPLSTHLSLIPQYTGV
eukprot:3246555-Pyramimonas_sp.AAC.2